MRIVLTSDTHGKFPDLPPGDVLIHAGDLTETGKYLQVHTAGEWLQSLDYKSIILVPGNHDFLFQEEEKKARRLLGRVHVLIDQELTHEGFKFYGSPWQPFFFDWAFNVKSYEERVEIWKKIPIDTKVLITHCPPFGILDRSVRGNSVGDEALAKRLSQLSELKLHVFGHIHWSYGLRKIEHTRYVNASHCDEEYNGTHPAVVVDL